MKNRGLLVQASGCLYIVATPIGNLEDITLRALRILKQVDFILCEDKRVTLKLLNKYGIKTKLISYHKFNEEKEIENITEVLKKGKSIALVSDAGTPLISDPGNILIRRLIKENIKVCTIPGPSALSSILSMCPFPLDSFLFLGFLPSKRNKRIELVSSLDKRSKNVIIFLAPHDFKKYLKETNDFYPDVNIFYAREMTKIYEEYWYGKISNLDLKKNIKGEIVLVLNFESPRPNDNKSSITNAELIKDIKDCIREGCSLKQATKSLANKTSLSSRDIYKIYIKNKG